MTIELTESYSFRTESGKGCGKKTYKPKNKFAKKFLEVFASRNKGYTPQMVQALKEHEEMGGKVKIMEEGKC